MVFGTDILVRDAVLQSWRWAVNADLDADWQVRGRSRITDGDLTEGDGGLGREM